MEKLKRKLFFWLLVLLFLVIAPTVVLRSIGYRFDTSRGIFVHSGAITLKTNPQTAQIYLNGKEDTSGKINRINNSYNLTGLLPKNYEITVTADGFQPWTKKTEVHSGVSSEFWNILLIRNEYEKTDYQLSEVNRFFISPKNKILAYAKNSESGLSVGVLDIQDSSVETTFSFPRWKLLDESHKENIEWSPEEDFLSIPVEQTESVTVSRASAKGPAVHEEKTTYAYFIADPNTQETFNLNQFLGLADLRDVRWDPKEKNYLFFLSQDSLYRANIKDASDLTKIAANVSAYELSQDYAYYTQSPNEIVYKTELNGKSERKQITENFPEIPSSPTDRLIVYDNERIAFIDKNKNLFLYNKGEHGTYFKKLGASIETIQFSNDGKKLLYAGANEISVYFLRDWKVQPVRAENESVNITRYSEPLKNIQWFKDYEHILFTTGAQIKIIELDPRDYRVCADVFKTNSADPFMVYNHAEEKLFFIDQNNNANNLYSIVFPEETTILGL